MNNGIFTSAFRKLLLSNYRKGDEAIFLNNYDKTIHDSNQCEYIFDFSDNKFFHLGDILFFAPLLNYLSKNQRVKVVASENLIEFLNLFIIDKTSIHIYSNITKINIEDIAHLIVTTPYKINDYKYYPKRCIVGLGMPKKLPTLPYPTYLMYIFLNSLNFHINEIECSEYMHYFKKVICLNIRNIAAIQTFDFLENSSNIFLCPYLGSGKFRDLFGRKYNEIISYAAIQKDLFNYDVLLIGGSNDLETPNLLFTDLRGRNLLHIIKLAASDSIIEGVGFDNFWMHLFDIIGKKYTVKFRGRFSKFGRNLHYNSVNISFSSGQSKYYI